MILAERELLESQALAEVCPCLYYDLADTIGETPDTELIAIIKHETKCANCGN